MVEYRIIDHTADMGLEVYGKDLPDLFKNAALALFDLLIDAEDIKNGVEMEIEVEGGNPEELMVNWLSELLYLSQTKGNIFKEAYIDEVSERYVKGRVKGERFNPESHRFKLEIKGVTYHMLEVRKKGNRWLARIIFDI